MSESNSEAKFLKNYNIHDFDVPLTTVDMAIFTLKDYVLQVLLVKRAQHPALGKWALPGGFIDLKKDHCLMDTAKRKLREKTGVNTPYLEQVASFGSSDRDPRGWSVTLAYFALLSWEEVTLSKDGSSDDIKWVAIDNVLNTINLAFDHDEILLACIERLRNKVQYTSLPINLLPEEFTLTEMQSTFELILRKKVEKKSFRRRILDANIIEETGNMKKGSNRPAKLYRAKSEAANHFFPRSIEGTRT